VEIPVSQYYDSSAFNSPEHISATSETDMKSYPPSSAVVDMQSHRPGGLETGSDSQLAIFSQSRAFCEADALRQVSRLSVDDNENSAEVPAHPPSRANPRLIKLARVTILTPVTIHFQMSLIFDHQLMAEFDPVWL